MGNYSQPLIAGSKLKPFRLSHLRAVVFFGAFGRMLA